MTASEMTNKELADLISDGCGTSMMGLATREAAARLRRLSVRSDNSAVITELRRRLKVAEEEKAQLKVRLSAVMKIARESRISREVKRRGLRIYVEVDDIAIALDMGKVVKSLNSIDAILRAASGEPETENKQTRKERKN